MKKRKPVGMAFHWFLPQPFGGDARESKLDMTDPMHYAHEPSDASPMFFDLLQDPEQEIGMPANAPFSVS